MTRYLDDATPHANSAALSTAKLRRQQEDQRRMAYRRAIEDFTAERRLQWELADFPDLLTATLLTPAPAVRRNEPPAH